MLKNFAIVVCLFIFAGVYTFAQDTSRIQKPQEEQIPQETQTQQQDTQQQESTAWNEVCPVDGKPVSGDAPVIRHNGKNYGFDKPSCALVFSEEPETYTQNLNEDGTQFAGERKTEPDKEREL